MSFAASSRARDLLKMARPIRVEPAQFGQMRKRRIEAMNGANGIGFRMIGGDGRQRLAIFRSHGKEGGVFALQIGGQRHQGAGGRIAAARLSRSSTFDFTRLTSLRSVATHRRPACRRLFAAARAARVMRTTRTRSVRVAHEVTVPACAGVEPERYEHQKRSEWKQSHEHLSRRDEAAALP